MLGDSVMAQTRPHFAGRRSPIATEFRPASMAFYRRQLEDRPAGSGSLSSRVKRGLGNMDKLVAGLDEIDSQKRLDSIIVLIGAVGLSGLGKKEKEDLQLDLCRQLLDRDLRSLISFDNVLGMVLDLLGPENAARFAFEEKPYARVAYIALIRALASKGESKPREKAFSIVANLSEEKYEKYIKEAIRNLVTYFNWRDVFRIVKKEANTAEETFRFIASWGYSWYAIRGLCEDLGSRQKGYNFLARELGIDQATELFGYMFTKKEASVLRERHELKSRLKTAAGEPDQKVNA